MKQLTERDIEMVNGAGWSEDVNKVADRLSSFGQDAVSDTGNAVNKAYDQISGQVFNVLIMRYNHPLLKSDSDG